MNQTRIVAFALAFGVAQSAAMAASASFPDVVAEILRHQKDGRIAEMDEQKKDEMIKCVNGVLADLPKGKKDYILEGASYDERENRFGEVVQANHAEWKGKIASGCADVAMDAGN